MCCDRINSKNEKQVGTCSACDTPVGEDGKSIDYEDCGYSPIICKVCDNRPCDQSC